MNKKQISELPILTPFRIKKDDNTYIKMPLFDGGGVACNAYYIEEKISCFIEPHIEVETVDLIVEEI